MRLQEAEQIEEPCGICISLLHGKLDVLLKRDVHLAAACARAIHLLSDREQAGSQLRGWELRLDPIQICKSLSDGSQRITVDDHRIHPVKVKLLGMDAMVVNSNPLTAIRKTFAYL